jgi:hypothetical protein
LAVIAHEDITFYTVGDAKFPKGMFAEVPHAGIMPSQAYNQAFKAAQETGLPIVAHGPS